MSEQLLPDFWTEHIDGKGRRYYSNHRTQRTQWERPVVMAAPPPKPGLPPPCVADLEAGQYQQQPTPMSNGCLCTPRLSFWVAVALGWIVWVFAVVAASHDKWLDQGSIAAAENSTLKKCIDDYPNGEFCDLYRAFSAVQVMATIVASVAMVVLTISLFRPGAAGCCSSTVLGFGGGVLMAIYAFLQLMAFMLIVALVKRMDETWWPWGDDANLDVTFGLSVVGFTFAMFEAGVLTVFAGLAGDGPFYMCVHDYMARSISAGISQQQYQPQPPRPMAAQPPQPVAASAPRPVASAAPQPAAIPPTAVPPTATKITASSPVPAATSGLAVPPEPSSSASKSSPVAVPPEVSSSASRLSPLPHHASDEDTKSAL